MVDIRHTMSCEAPIDVAFDYLDDYTTATQWMFGLTGFEPVGEQSQGAGAVFHARFVVRPVKVSSTVEVTEWVRNEVIAFNSVDGLSNTSVWRFSETGPNRTRIAVQLSYRVPGGLAGRALGRALEPIVALSVRQSDGGLRRGIEQRYAQMRK